MTIGLEAPAGLSWAGVLHVAAALCPGMPLPRCHAALDAALSARVPELRRAAVVHQELRADGAAENDAADGAGQADTSVSKDLRTEGASENDSATNSTFASCASVSRERSGSTSRVGIDDCVPVS